MLFQGPLALGAVNNTEVADAGIGLRGGAGAHEVRNRDGGEEADNGDDDHNFDEREPTLFLSLHLHSLIDLSVVTVFMTASSGLI